MADISQVKLPDGTTYNLKDSYVRTNYRALSNNDFDTINVTELNAGDLIVTGAARFLNTINADISGTSSNVTGTVAIANGGTGATSAANARTNLAVPNMISDTYPTLLPTNGSNNWIKIGTSNSNYGLLPSVAGNAGSGHNSLGTSTWYWKYAYIDEIHGTLKGNADTATSATTATKLGSSNVGSATNPIYLASGTATACTYSLNKTVPSDAVFTDQYVSQSATTTSDYRKIVLSYQNGAAGAAVTSNTNVVYVTANAEVQPSTGNIRSAGTVSAANLSASGNVSGTTLGVISSSGTGGGISLYNGTGNVTTYGIAMRKTTDSGKHGYVQGDWGIYNYMSGGTTRGWVWRYGNTTNVASISSEGHAAFTGSVTIGANATNTSGVRQVYNETTKSLDFVFVA